MITYRKPTSYEINLLYRYFEDGLDYGMDTDEDIDEKYQAIKSRIENAPFICVFDNYPFKFEEFPHLRVNFTDALMFVIWDNNPYHSEVFLIGKNDLCIVHEAQN